MRQFPSEIRKILNAPDIPPLKAREYFPDLKVRHVILVILDGTSYRVLNQAYMPFIHKLKANGTEFNNCRTSFPTITGSAHTSINTGTYPEQHGFGLPLSYRNGQMVTARSRDGFSGYVSEALRQSGLSTASIADATMQGAMCYLSVEFFGHSIERGGELARWTLKTLRPSLLSVTFYAPDTLNHLYGPENEHTLLALEHIDHELKLVTETLDELGLLADTVFIITSDHGHADSSKPVNEIFLDFGERGQIYVPNLRSIALYDPMDRILADLEGLDAVECILDHGELEVLGYHALESEYVACLRPGHGWHEDEPSLGNHGGITIDERHVPLIISSPRLKAGSVDSVVDTIDIAPTISALLGAKFLPSYQGRILSEIIDHEHASDDLVREITEMRTQRELSLESIRSNKVIEADQLRELSSQRRSLEREYQATLD